MVILRSAFYYNFLCEKYSQSWNLLNDPRTIAIFAKHSQDHGWQLVLVAEGHMRHNLRSNTNNKGQICTQKCL